jgi:tetrapyrrole methylase family protein/MazG family protein
MARQARAFDIGDVLAQTSRKLIRRHPHVFGNLAVQGNDEVLHNWEQIKAQELAEKGRTRRSALDGIPAALPALAACQKVGNRAARSGFDWPEAAGAWAKLREELDELQHAYEHDTHASSAASRAHLAEEMGDALYALAQVARWLDIDAESALREANGKFRRRFQAVEKALQEQGRRLADLTLEEKITLWQAAKQQA